MANSLKQKVVKGAIWTLLEKLCCQIVGFVVSMILARLLTPGDYGTIALLTIFIAIADILVSSGFGCSLTIEEYVALGIWIVMGIAFYKFSHRPQFNS